MRKLSIIIPCFNEKLTINELLSKVELLNIQDWEKEVVIVDDMSTDGTRELLKNLGGQFKVIYHEKNLGKGSAVRTGIKKSTGDYILIQDADLEYNPNEIPNLINKLGSNKRLVVYGSRNLQNRGRKMMIVPRLGVWFITKEFNFLFNTELTDLWTCYKLFPREAGTYFENGGFESELSFSARIIKNDFEIIEVPISHKPRLFTDGKKIKYSDGLKGIWTIFKERFY